MQGENPENGRLVSRQSGSEQYTGYHTIELEQPAVLHSNSQFSIVIEFDNPEYENPIPVETYGCEDPEEDFVEEMGTGHESYVYDYESAQWEDVYGMADSFVLTNVCIKGFTNPLPESKEELSTVRSSQMDGEVNDGTLLELSSAGNEPIEYSMDGSVFAKYTAPIELRFALPDQTHTLLARTVNEEGQTGNTVTRTYSKASAQIGTNRVDSARARQIVSFENGSATIELRNDEEDIYVQTISPDSIAVNGEPAERFAWSDPIELEEGEEVTLQISASAPGKKNSEAALHVRRSPLHFVYRSETISFDSKYTVSTLDGDPIPNGDSIGRLIDDELPAPLLLTYTAADVYKGRGNFRYRNLDNSSSMVLAGDRNRLCERADQCHFFSRHSLRLYSRSQRRNRIHL